MKNKKDCSTYVQNEQNNEATKNLSKITKEKKKIFLSTTNNIKSKIIMYARTNKKINMKKSPSMNVCTYISFRWHGFRPNGITSCLKIDKSNKNFLRFKIDLESKTKIKNSRGFEKKI